MVKRRTPVWDENERQEEVANAKMRDELRAEVMARVNEDRRERADEEAREEEQRQILRAANSKARAIIFDAAYYRPGVYRIVDKRVDKVVLRIEFSPNGQYIVATDDGRTLVGDRDTAINALRGEPYNYSKSLAETVVDRLEREAQARELEEREILPEGPAGVLARAGIDPDRLRAQYQNHASKVGNAAVNKGVRAINYDEVAEVARAAMVLLEMVERGRVTVEVDEIQAADAQKTINEYRATFAKQDKTISQQARQIKSQADTIDELQAKIRELQGAPPVPTMDEATLKAAVQERKDKAMFYLDARLFGPDAGPVEAPNNLDEDLRAWLRDLATRNKPQPGAKVNTREVAALAMSVLPLLDEIERLDEILLFSLQILPCHNQDHVEDHGRGDMCEDQLGLIGLQLIRAIGLPPTYLPRVLHARDKCRICAKPDQALGNWLDTGAFQPGAAPNIADIITDEDIVEDLPWN